MFDSNLIDSFIDTVVFKIGLRRENTFSARALSHTTDESLSSDDDSINIRLAFLLMLLVDVDREDFILEELLISRSGEWRKYFVFVRER